MSDTTAAVLVLPILIVFTLALECTRIGCVWVYRSWRATSSASGTVEAPSGAELSAEALERCSRSSQA